MASPTLLTTSATSAASAQSPFGHQAMAASAQRSELNPDPDSKSVDFRGGHIDLHSDLELAPLEFIPDEESASSFLHMPASADLLRSDDQESDLPHSKDVALTFPSA